MFSTFEIDWISCWVCEAMYFMKKKKVIKINLYFHLAVLPDLCFHTTFTTFIERYSTEQLVLSLVLFAPRDKPSNTQNSLSSVWKVYCNLSPPTNSSIISWTTRSSEIGLSTGWEQVQTPAWAKKTAAQSGCRTRSWKTYENAIRYTI